MLEGASEEDWVVPATDPAQGFRLAVEAPDRASLLAARAAAPSDAGVAGPPGIDLAHEVVSEAKGAAGTRRTGSSTACTSTRSTIAPSSASI